MSSEADVSVVLPVYKPRLDYLQQTLQSLLNQTCSPREVIVVEAGPESAGQLEEISNSRVQLLHVEEPSTARQQDLGLRKARGSFIAIIGGDDIAEADRLQRQRDFLIEHPGVDVLGSQTTIIDPGGEIVGYREYPTEHAQIVRKMRRSNPLAAPSVMFRGPVAIEAGGFAYDSHGGMAEDYELWCRLASRGATFANHPEFLTRYRVHPASMKSTQTHNLLRASIAIKQQYWAGQMDAGDRLRLLAERALLRLPPGWIVPLFRLWTYRRGKSE